MNYRDVEGYDQQIGSKIMSYFRQNPFAKDSCRGIASCWVHEDFELVERALTLLVRKGLISKETRRGTAFYKLSKSSLRPAQVGGHNDS